MVHSAGPVYPFAPSLDLAERYFLLLLYTGEKIYRRRTYTLTTVIAQTAPNRLPRKHPKKRINNTVSYPPFDRFIPNKHPARMPTAEAVPKV